MITKILEIKNRHRSIPLLENADPGIQIQDQHYEVKNSSIAALLMEKSPGT
jgi:hypothetical protein